MDLLIVIMAAVLVWVVGALWYRLTKDINATDSALQVRNIGDPRGKPVAPYILAGVALVAVAGMMRVLFVRAGIDGMLPGIGWGAGIGAFIVAPWFVIENTCSPRRMTTTIVDIGYAVLAGAVFGAVMGAI